jgi:hypothetical protein
MSLVRRFDDTALPINIPPSAEPDRHRLVIVREPRQHTVELESILETAERRGFTRIASSLRDKIIERDFDLIERAAFSVAVDPSLGHCLIKFASERGVLRCRAWVDEEQESRLIELLGAVENAETIALEIIR